MKPTAFSFLPLAKIVRSCVRKKAYAKRQAAKRTALIIRRKHGYNMDIYRCPCCQQWHLYSKNKVRSNGSA